jgi:hypothetical protein
VVNVRAKAENLVKRGSRKGSTQSFVGRVSAKRDVVAIEKAVQFLAKDLVINQVWPEHEGFKEPGCVCLVPFGRFCFRA